MNDLIFYPVLSTRSRRALMKTKGRFGNTHVYRPKFPLIKRLMQQFNMNESQVMIQLLKERQQLIENHNNV